MDEIISNTPDVTTPGLSRLERGFACALRLHALQRRKGSEIPYISHLMAVAALVLENGGGEDEAIAALLHDAIEDQDLPAESIARTFGGKVARIVEGCTDANTRPKPPWRARKEAYIAHVCSAEPDVCLVSLADKVHNARSLLFDYRQVGEELWSRFSGGGKEGTLWYYRTLVGSFRQAGANPALVDELDRTITELERLAGAEEWEGG